MLSQDVVEGRRPDPLYYGPGTAQPHGHPGKQGDEEDAHDEGKPYHGVYGDLLHLGGKVCGVVCGITENICSI